VSYYKEGPSSVAAEIQTYKDKPLVREAIESIREKFRSQNAEGPNWVADFEELEGDAREPVKTEAYQRMQQLLKLLDDTK
jgi:hypothetical protein